MHFPRLLRDLAHRVTALQDAKARWRELGLLMSNEEHILKIPVGIRARDKRLKNVGLFQRVNMQEGLEALSMMPLTRALNRSPERVQVFLADVDLHSTHRGVSLLHMEIYVQRKQDPDTGQLLWYCWYEFGHGRSILKRRDFVCRIGWRAPRINYILTDYVSLSPEVF